MKTNVLFLVLCLVSWQAVAQEIEIPVFEWNPEDKEEQQQPQPVQKIEAIVGGDYSFSKEEFFQQSYDELQSALDSMNEKELQEFSNSMQSVFGGVIGNGGGTVVLPDGSTSLADLYIDLKELGSIDLPNYYRDFNWKDYPGLREEWDHVIGFVEGHFGQSLLPLGLDQLKIVKTPILLREIKYRVQEDVKFQSTGFAYTSALSSLKDFSTQYVRVVEIKESDFDRLSNRHKALFLLHEALHFNYQHIYEKYHTRFVLISYLIDHLEPVLEANDQQLANGYRPIPVSEEVKQHNIQLHVILERLKGKLTEDIELYASDGGGLSRSQEFSRNNYIDLASIIKLGDASSSQEEKIQGNEFYTTSLRLFNIDFLYEQSGDCKNNRFINVKVDILTCVDAYEGLLKNISSEMDVQIKLKSYGNRIEDFHIAFPYTKVLRIMHQKDSLTRVSFTGAQVKNTIYTHHFRKNPNNPFFPGYFLNQVFIEDSQIVDSQLEASVKVKKSQVYRSKLMHAQLYNTLIQDSSVNATHLLHSSLKNSSLVASMYRDNIVATKLSLQDSHIFTESPWMRRFAPRPHVISNFHFLGPLTMKQRKKLYKFLKEFRSFRDPFDMEELGAMTESMGSPIEITGLRLSALGSKLDFANGSGKSFSFNDRPAVSCDSQKSFIDRLFRLTEKGNFTGRCNDVGPKEFNEIVCEELLARRNILDFVRGGEVYFVSPVLMHDFVKQYCGEEALKEQMEFLRGNF